MSELAGRRVLVVGLGISGFAAALTLLDNKAKVKVTEGSASPVMAERADRLRSMGATVEIGGHDLDALDCDLAVVSPGISPSSDIFRGLIEQGVPVWSEVELASRLAHCDFLAVTGTNGKTTTTTLLAAMLEAGGVPSLAAGNIGLPVIEAIGQVPPGGAIALEISSFQLATIETFCPKVAVVLNLGEDHSDWHGGFDAYVASKTRITENQGPSDVFIPCSDDALAMSMAEATSARVVPFSGSSLPPDGAGFREGKLFWRDQAIADREEITLPGRAGAEDAAAAAAAALEYGVDPIAVAQALKDFTPLRHRFESVRTLDGVHYVDDSKATNPHATLSALADLREVVLIAGGRSKGIDLSPLIEAAHRLTAVIALGEAADELRQLFDGVVPVERVGSMEEAVASARSRSSAGGSVLLSPACASLDMYESYAARGDHFARSVLALQPTEEVKIDGH
ncbi:MAG: UDP-N-acetylmuramoyl-L-alanine--D-glutamate ligase [Actinobacteria bacterium]|nr:UDP-N-acetylmuramoyl-L-alanine--D-glutamate ligase [Actinomycetota bacterium]